MRMFSQRDLFRVTFERFSRFEWPTYCNEFLHQLPSHLLRAAGANRVVLECPGFDELCENVHRSSHQQWNNPELYPHLFSLLRQPNGVPPEDTVRCLELHMGSIELNPTQFRPGFYRLRLPTPKVCRVQKTGISEVADVIVPQITRAPFPIVYLPYSGLFDDVVGSTLYDGSDRKLWEEHVEVMIDAAASSLQRYSAELYNGFCEAIGTIGLTGEPDVTDRSSYSSRMYYAGGIFSSLLRNNVPALVENLIHEYYHQRLWVWWSIEAPQDLPSETLTIESPVTKTRKSVRVMLHALMIYLGVCDFYQFALGSESLTPGIVEWVEKRVAHLSNGTHDLVAILLQNLAPYPQSQQFTQFLADLM